MGFDGKAAFASEGSFFLMLALHWVKAIAVKLLLIGNWLALSLLSTKKIRRNDFVNKRHDNLVLGKEKNRNTGN